MLEQVRRRSLRSAGTARRPAAMACNVYILGATGLAKADILASDPFCLVYWRDELVHRTAVQPKTLEPVWDEQVELASEAALAACGLEGELRVEIWDHDETAGDSESDFLGCARVEYDYDGEQHAGFVRVPLTEKPGLAAEVAITGALTLVIGDEAMYRAHRAAHPQARRSFLSASLSASRTKPSLASPSRAPRRCS